MSSELEPGRLRFEEVTKVYDRQAERARWRYARPGRPPEPLEPVVAVDRVSLDIAPAERIGIIGPNGAGKSTLLRLVAGVTHPTTGRVGFGGRVGAMIELGLGFHPDLDGWENLRSGGAVMGRSPREVERALPAMVDFAGIGAAMDEPLRHYSTGMKARLGFALATQFRPDLLIVDEVLAVGDPDFQQRCIERIHTMCADGTTLVLVSHAMWLIDSVCARAVHLDHGTVVDDGPAPEVIDRYLVPESTARPRVADPPVRFSSFEVERTDLDPWEAVPLRARLEVDRPVDGAAIEVDFAWAMIAPDFPIAHASARLPDGVCRAGGQVVGTSTPIPTDTGHVGLRARLVDPRSGATFDEAEAEFWIAREVVGRLPQLAAEVSFSLAPADAAGDGAKVSAAVTGGELVGRLVGVSKRFPSTRRGLDRRALPGRWGEVTDVDVVALDDVTLDLPRNVSTGLIGPNGSGKTTLLKLLAGTLAPTEGRVTTSGRVVSMLELGLGFHPDLPGTENVLLTARLLGLSTAQLRERLPAILDFAGLGDAAHAPLRQYSTGMQARLGLAVAVHTDPDLLLVDEALAVGDEQFRHRAVRAVEELRTRGVGVVFVSHDLRLVEEVCDRVVRLERGRIVDDGPAPEILARVGGDQWTGGTTQELTALGLGELSVGRHRVPTGGRFEFAGRVEVTQPAPWARLELRLMVRLDEGWVMTPEEEAAHTVLARVLEPAGGRLAEPGWYNYEGVVERTAIIGDVDVRVVAVDERAERVVASAWQAVTFGNPRPGHLTPVSCPVEIRWDEVTVAP